MKTLLRTLFILSSFVFVACSQSPNKIAKGTIEDAVEDFLKKNKFDQFYTVIETGYYELNSKYARETLAKLKAAGIIDYNVERFAWWNKHLQAGLSWGGYYGYKEYFYEEHFMVNVSLTDKGKKIVVDSIPLPKSFVDEDMKQPEIDLSKFPESNYKKEKWPEIPCPEAEDGASNEQEEIICDAGSEDSYEYTNLHNLFDEIEDDNISIKENEREAYLSLDIETKTQYELKKEKENSRKAVVKSSALKVDKVRYVRTYIDPQTGIAMATAEVIVKTIDVTAAGRVMDGKFEGTKQCAPVIFAYFDDKGWMLQNSTFNFQQISSIGTETLKQGINANGIK